MALPRQPDITSIVNEGLKRAGIQNTPNTFERARDQWLPEVINDIINQARASGRDGLFEVLHITSTTVTITNQRRYALPTDFDEGLSIQLLNGSHTGTAQASPSATTITLAAAEDVAQTAAEGREILITGGRGAGQTRQIISYDTTTKIATVDVGWDSDESPDSTSTYLIVDDFLWLDREGVTEMEEDRNLVAPARPRSFSQFNNEYILDRPADKVYGLRLRYYANPNQIDLTDVKYTKMFRDWQSALVEGLRAIGLEDQDNTSAREARQQFTVKIAGILAKERPFGDEFEGFELKAIPGSRPFAQRN